MTLIGWGLMFLIVGIILAAVGFGIGGPLQYIGWVVLVVGVVLALIHVIGHAGRRREAV